MTYKEEFGDQYNIPDAIINAADLTDESWHNDACPSFHCDATDQTLWVEHPNPEEREFSTYSRFTVTTADDGVCTPVYDGDDVDAALVAVRTERPLADRLADLMKPEILKDMEAGRVDTDTPSFQDLHDFVDANEYVIQACEAAGFDWSGDQDDLDIMNAATDMVDAWLKERAEQFKGTRTDAHGMTWYWSTNLQAWVTVPEEG